MTQLDIVNGIDIPCRYVRFCGTCKDPRFNTEWSCNDPLTLKHRFFKCPYPSSIYLPKSAVIRPKCDPEAGYQPQRRDKGYDLTVNDYPLSNVTLNGPGRTPYVYPWKQL